MSFGGVRILSGLGTSEVCASSVVQKLSCRKHFVGRDLQGKRSLQLNEASWEVPITALIVYFRGHSRGFHMNKTHSQPTACPLE
jgi:hypothetical protein